MTIDYDKIRKKLPFYCSIYNIIIFSTAFFLIFNTDTPDRVAQYLSIPKDYELLIDVAIAALIAIVAFSIGWVAFRFVMKRCREQ